MVEAAGLRELAQLEIPTLQVLASGPRRTAETAFHRSVFSVRSVAKMVSASTLHISVLSVLSVAKIQYIQAYK